MSGVAERRTYSPGLRSPRVLITSDFVTFSSKFTHSTSPLTNARHGAKLSPAKWMPEVKLEQGEDAALAPTGQAGCGRYSVQRSAEAFGLSSEVSQCLQPGPLSVLSACLTPNTRKGCVDRRRVVAETSLCVGYRRPKDDRQRQEPSCRCGAASRHRRLANRQVSAR